MGYEKNLSSTETPEHENADSLELMPGDTIFDWENNSSPGFGIKEDDSLDYLLKAYQELEIAYQTNEMTPEELHQYTAEDLSWRDENAPHQTTGGPDEDYFSDPEIYQSCPKPRPNEADWLDDETDFEKPYQSPELIGSEKLPYRRRRRLRFTLQMNNAGIPEFVPSTSDQLKFDHNHGFRHQAITPLEWQQQQRFHPEINTTGERPEMTWLERNNELAFIVQHLPARSRTSLERAILHGEKVNFNFIWGPKWKLTNFAPDKIGQYIRTQLPNNKKERKFHGSNYLAFTRIFTYRDKRGELCVQEQLLAEANLDTKGGSHSVHKNHSSEKVYIDRSLPGLVRRHQEGDPYLDEPEFLYNQFSSLYESGMSPADQAWIEPAFINFMQQQIKDRHYQVRVNPRKSFKINSSGKVIFESTDKPELNPIYMQALRVNAKKNSFLHEVIEKESAKTHRHLRAEKIREFEQNYYPIWKQACLAGKWGTAELADQLMDKESKIKFFFTPKHWRTLAYLLHQFLSDPDFESQFQIGPAGITPLLEAINARNAERKPWSQLHLKEKDLQKICDSVARRLEEMLTVPDTASIDDLIGQEVVEIGPQVHGPRYTGRHKPPLKKKSSRKRPLVLFKDPEIPIPPTNAKKAEALPLKDTVIAYDVLPKRTSLETEQDNLARIFIEYVIALHKDEIYPTSFTMWSDQELKEYGGISTSGQFLYNQARVHFRPNNYGRGSSLVALHRLFDRAKLLVETCCPPELRPIVLEQLDYSQHPRLAKEFRHAAGVIGEIFTHLVVNDALPQLVSDHIPNITSSQLLYADHERKNYRKFLQQFCAERADDKECRPDFVVNATTASGQTVEILFDSKAWIKNITPLDISEIYQGYSPHLTNPHRRLVVVYHGSRVRKIAKGTAEAAAARGIIIVTAETVRATLATINPDKYRNQESHRDLPDDYDAFIKQPIAFAAKPANVRNFSTIADIVKANQPFTQQEFFLQ